jgi:hypothetical protein
VPPELADQSVTCEYVSEVETLVQLIAPLFDVDPPDGAANAPAAWRTLFPAIFDVPADPGAPTWSWA